MTFLLEPVTERLRLRSGGTKTSSDSAFTFEHPKIREGSALRAHGRYRLSRADWAAGRS